TRALHRIGQPGLLPPFPNPMGFPRSHGTVKKKVAVVRGELADFPDQGCRFFQEVEAVDEEISVKIHKAERYIPGTRVLQIEKKNPDGVAFGPREEAKGVYQYRQMAPCPSPVNRYSNRLCTVGVSGQWGIGRSSFSGRSFCR